jgi:hypothetical protein
MGATDRDSLIGQKKYTYERAHVCLWKLDDIYTNVTFSRTKQHLTSCYCEKVRMCLFAFGVVKNQKIYALTLVINI